MIHVVSVRVGDKYGPEYTHILHDMVHRNMSNLDICHWQVTDDPDSLPEPVNYIPANPDLPGWWQKPYLFSADMPWNEGDQIIYFDLDVAITGRLEDLKDRKGIIQDWLWPCYNSSVMRWDHGEHREIWERFTPDLIDKPGRMDVGYPKGVVNGGDQEWITECGGWDTFPPEWFRSYRQSHDWPPAGSKAVIFHGEPKPDACEGWVKDVWKIGGYTSLPVMTGINVTYDTIRDNIRANLDRKVSWFTGFGSQSKAAVIVCGGPSMKDCLSDIKAQRRRGAKIITVNNAMRYLMAHGLTPDAHVMLDARPENVEFLKDAPTKTRYFLASQCDPSLFDAVPDPIMWHNAFGDGEELRAMIGEKWDTHPVVLVPGGGTVGLRAIWLAYLSGYTKIHIYGMDSSYSDGAHHAYAQSLNDQEQTLRATMGGKVYTCAKWMLRQSEEFRDTWRDMTSRGVSLFVHGSGLIPDIARQLRAAA